MNVALLKNKVKSYRLIYNLYFYFGSIMLSILRFFVKTDEKLILFVSYGGRKYDDSPQIIFEAMVNDARFKEYNLVWAFEKPDLFESLQCNKVQINSLTYLLLALKARVWITNVDMRRGLSFDGMNTLYVNTWHGTAIKYIGSDCDTSGQEFNAKTKRLVADIMLAQGEHDVKVFSKAFRLDKSQIYLTGLPRNDILVKGNESSTIIGLKKRLNIPCDKKIILYAPTFREYDGAHSWEQTQPLNLDLWEKILGKDYLLLIRGHQVVQTMLGVKESHFVKDVTPYPNLNDLMLVSDILISDYSSIVFDYSILERPMFCYVYDYDKYNKTRGMYFDIRKDLSNTDNEEEMVEMIQKIDWDYESEKARKFRDKYVQQYGNASAKVLDLIYDRISKQN